MRVICINDEKGVKTGEPPIFKVGQVCEAIQCPTYAHCYEITEHLYSPKTGKRKSWRKHRFIPLSDIDETELIKEREQLTTI